MRSFPRSQRMVAVAGNIGSGKSSLVEWLRQHFALQPYFEPHDENPYLTDFYRDMQRWAYQSQLFFLIRRNRLHRAMQTQGVDVVQDRTIYEDSEIFAAHLHRKGLIADRDWRVYRELYETLLDELRPPDLLIYLSCPVRILRTRIAKRARAFEQAVPTQYLNELEDLYGQWLRDYKLSPVIVLATDRLDYVQNLFDRQELVEQISKVLQPSGDAAMWHLERP